MKNKCLLGLVGFNLFLLVAIIGIYAMSKQLIPVSRTDAERGKIIAAIEQMEIDQIRKYSIDVLVTSDQSALSWQNLNYTTLRAWSFTIIFNLFLIVLVLRSKK